MTIYRIWGATPEDGYAINTIRTSWHTDSKEAWKEMKRRTGKSKQELKALGYKKETITDGLKGDNLGTEQMILQGR